MIEPLAVGDAVCFGPNTRNFAREVDQLLACQAASQLNEPADLTNFLRNCLEEPGYRDALLSNARRFFDAHGTPDQPAWQRTLEQLDRLLDHRTLAAQSRAA